jgi:radical SAM protein with 4Fe4S-binding SPASM domain
MPPSYQKKKELKTQEVFSILEQLKKIGCFYLGFTGGEPFVRKDIMDILWYAKRCGFELIIYTNGSLINERIAKELKAIRPNKIDITIPAMSKNAFERISGIKGSQDKVFKAIELLYKKGINLGFKTCVLKENESEISQIQNFAASRRALHRLDTILLPRLDGSREPYRYRGELRRNLVVSRKSYVASQNLEIETQKSECDLQTENRKPRTETLFRCGAGTTQAAITPSGELKMCLMIDYPKYKILETSLKDSWMRLKKLVENIKPDKNYKCTECKLQSYCKWCPARGWLYQRNFTVCEPESKRWAEVIKESYNV